MAKSNFPDTFFVLCTVDLGFMLRTFLRPVCKNVSRTQKLDLVMNSQRIICHDAFSNTQTSPKTSVRIFLLAWEKFHELIRKDFSSHESTRTSTDFMLSLGNHFQYVSFRLNFLLFMPRSVAPTFFYRITLQSRINIIFFFCKLGCPQTAYDFDSVESF